MIIAIAGEEKSGKETLAKYFAGRGFTKIDLGDNLKEMCSYAFGIPIEYFYDNVLQETVFFNPIVITTAHIDLLNAFIAQTHQFKLACLPHIGEKMFSPKMLMQYVDTEMLEKACNTYNDDVFTMKMCNIGNIVCTGIEFKSQLACLGKFAADSNDQLISIYMRRTLEAGKHASGNNITERDASIIILNNGTIQNLHKKIEGLMATYYEAVVV